MGILYGRAGRLTVKNGGFGPGQRVDRDVESEFLLSEFDTTFDEFVRPAAPRPASTRPA
jgi:hypothetical protein